MVFILVGGDDYERDGQGRGRKVEYCAGFTRKRS